MATNTEILGFNEPHQYTLEELIEIKEKQDLNVASHELVDEFTGQVCRCRSSLNNKGYMKLEVNTMDSETDTSLYEPIESLIDRCRRAGILKDWRRQQSINQSVFDNPDNLDLDEDFDETQLSTYDIIDENENIEKRVIETVNRINNAQAGATKSGDDKERGTSDTKEPDQGATA